MSTGTARIRILAVDDYPDVREGIAALIAIPALGPDVTVMDVQMPEMNGRQRPTTLP